jgi:hypothetical protein
MAVSLLSPAARPYVEAEREQVRVGDLVDSMSRWQTASERARHNGLLLRIEFADDPRGSEPYRVSSFTRDAWYSVSPRLTCDCPAGQHGHVCQHAARVALWWWHLGVLRRCARCGGWDHTNAGERRHVGGLPDTDERWTHYACMVEDVLQ